MRAVTLFVLLVSQLALSGTCAIRDLVVTYVRVQEELERFVRTSHDQRDPEPTFKALRHLVYYRDRNLDIERLPYAQWMMTSATEGDNAPPTSKSIVETAQTWTCAILVQATLDRLVTEHMHAWLDRQAFDDESALVRDMTDKIDRVYEETMLQLVIDSALINSREKVIEAYTSLYRTCVHDKLDVLL